MAFTIRRGTNISHWLSQSNRRGAERRAFFTEADVRRLADWGFDHLRIPVDEEQLWDEKGHPDAEAFDLLDAALDWTTGAGMKAVVDLHILRSHHFNAGVEPRLFTDPVEAATFVTLWRRLSDQLEPWPVDQVAYELMNEPVAARASDWNRVALPAYQAIRQREPHRTIVLGSNRWNSVDTFNELEVPDDPRTILTFHYYQPMLITHYRAPWWAGGSFYEGPVRYPGTPVPEEDLARIPEPQRSALAAMNKPFDRNAMAASLAQPLAVAARTGLPLYCGEFGAYEKAPQEARLAWTRDLVSLFKEHGIAWANWDYKGGFALVKDGASTGIAEAMLGAS